ncbi:MAG: phospholipid/glycerol acyltransferase [Bacteroidetes bacterium]|nr:phospholipid/glycerol acyltransferase [Bacteroidota bacterium]
MNEEIKTVRIDFDQIASTLFAGKKIPRFLMRILKKIAHEDGLNELFDSAPGKKNMDFVDACMDFYRIECRVKGIENLPADAKPLIFASNHPLGALDAISILHSIGHRFDGKIKFYANEILNHVEPLREMVLPVSKYSYQGRNNVRKVQEFFRSSEHLLIFPAGATSRKYGDEIIDLEWQKNFIQKSVHYNRDVVPLYFEARNSTFFYFLEKIREKMHSRINFEMLFLVDEIFKQKGNTFTLYIGQTVSWETFDDSKTLQEWATVIKEMAYKLPEKTN